MLVDDEEVTRSAFREVRLSQYVLHSSDRTGLSLIIDILQLMLIIWLVNYSITFLKVNQFIVLLGPGILSRLLLLFVWALRSSSIEILR